MKLYAYLLLLGYTVFTHTQDIPFICLNEWCTRSELSQSPFNPDGTIQESNLVRLLQQSKVLDISMLDETYQASSLMNEKGSHTKQLFLIQSPHPHRNSYILKEVDPEIAEMEINFLKKLVQSNKIESLSSRIYKTPDYHVPDTCFYRELSNS